MAQVDKSRNSQPLTSSFTRKPSHSYLPSLLRYLPSFKVLRNPFPKYTNQKPLAHHLVFGGCHSWHHFFMEIETQAGLTILIPEISQMLKFHLCTAKLALGWKWSSLSWSHAVPQRPQLALELCQEKPCFRQPHICHQTCSLLHRLTQEPSFLMVPGNSPAQLHTLPSLYPLEHSQFLSPLAAVSQY